MADLSWISLLPQAPPIPTPGQMEQTNRLRLLNQATRQQMQGYNALGQLFRDPSNVDPNTGLLNQNALSSLAAQGYPQQMLDMLEAQSKLSSQRLSSMMNRDKLLAEQRKSMLADYAPLVATYDEDRKTLGDQGALEKFKTDAQQIYESQKSSGRYIPGLVNAPPSYDPERLRAAVIGPSAIQTPAEMRKEGREEAASARANVKTFEPMFVGDVVGSDGKVEKGVPLAYGGPNGYVDTRSNTPAKLAPEPNIRKMGTKGEADIEAAGVPTGPTDQHGDEYLKALPSSRAALVRGYAEGRVQFPGSFSLRSPYWQKMVADITQYDPSFDAVNYNARARTRADFTSGKSAQNITSFNTAIGHLGTLDKAAIGLENTWSPLWNSVANAVESAKGDPRIVRFETAKQAVADELTRAFRGTGGNVADIRGWEANLNASNSPAQLRAAITQAVDLLRSRIESVGEQYKRGMGTTADVMDLLTPAAKRTLAQLPGGEDLTTDRETKVAPRGKSETVEPPAASAPAPGAPPLPPLAPPPQPAGVQGGGGPPAEAFKGKKYLTNPATNETWERRDDGSVVKVR